MNINKIGYWTSTILMCALFAFSAVMYFTNYEMIAELFPTFGFPNWLVYPLAIAKVLGIIAVLTRASNFLKEWAYAGFFFDAILAFGAHYYSGDGNSGMAIFGIFIVLLSRFFESRYFNNIT